MLASARRPVKARAGPPYTGQVRVAVVIPARNEEASLPLVLGAIPRQLVDEVVVVDNASSDGTAEVARAAGASILFEPRPGYGAACLRGVEYLRIRMPDVVVFLDADFSDHPEEMPLLLEPIARDAADLVIGSRVKTLRERGALLPQARAGNWLATRLMRLFYGGRFTDLGPFRAIRFGALLDLGMADRGFGWTVEMQVKALQAGLRTGEVPVSYRRRVGVSKITGTVSGTIRAGARILWTLARHLGRGSRKLAGDAPGALGRSE